jgi:predicted ATPase
LAERAERFFVLTGGPGSGKSTLIEALRAACYSGMPEAGRGVIQDQMAIGGGALPWNNPTLFAEMMLAWVMRSYRNAQQGPGVVFFDRGVVDVAGYLRLLGMPVPKHVEKAIELFRYNREVFVAPPWEEIFEQDHERKQDFNEAIRTCEAVTAAYLEFGYELVELPRASVEERVRFVLETAKMHGENFM